MVKGPDAGSHKGALIRAPVAIEERMILMKKWGAKCAAGLMAVAMAFSLTGCNIVEVDETKDRQQVVAKVGDVEILKGELLDLYDQQKAYYGITEDYEKSSPDQVKEFKTVVLDAIIAQHVMEAQAEKEGYTDFTNEEQAAAEKQVDEMLDAQREQFVTEAEAEKEEDPSIDVEARADEKLAELMEKNKMTRESLIEDQLMETAIQKMQDELFKDIEVTDDEIKEKYDTLVEEAKEKYDESIDQFYYEQSYGYTIYYQPEGFFYVKHILIGIPEDKQSEIAALRTDGDTAGADALRDEELAKIKEQADLVLQKVQSGEDFDALIAEYGADKGMEASPAKEKGYLVGEKSSFVTEFLNAALGLSEVGDTTDLVASDYGYHIIRKVSDAKPGPVDLNEVKDAVRSSLLSDMQNEKLSTQVEEWRKGMDVQVYENRY